ncbi:hypothetical protein [Acinetobacter courvalinii]|uniref:hypothetical protein n=1 Tax=Acinetobacter courvalinii TaxID=280147 RepID=UPI0021D1D75D|nr:hypothetical protein [Acinetobacter courvalinii]MCU4639185.1 hypothetical protein [Acinetobacter courvalinii]
MKKWVCKNCGLYRKVNPNNIKVGQRVYFYKKKKCEEQTSVQINEEPIKGVVLRKENGLISVLTNKGISKVNDKDLYLESAPVNFVYNMFGVCEC